jgi:hypothetical protein
MSSTLLLPHAHSFVKGPAVINTHTNSVRSTSDGRGPVTRKRVPDYQRTGTRRSRNFPGPADDTVTVTTQTYYRIQNTENGTGLGARESRWDGSQEDKAVAAAERGRRRRISRHSLSLSLSLSLAISLSCLSLISLLSLSLSRSLSLARSLSQSLSQ